MNKQNCLTLISLLAMSSLAGGCKYQEGLIINTMKGTVVVPRAAAIKTGLDAAGNPLSADPNIANIGPVYIGVFPSVYPANVVASFPHPEVGPQYQDGVEGDTYPYGGTTVGDIRFACFQALACKVTSGRFVDYDAMAIWFNDILGQPIVSADNQNVTSGELIRQTCFDLLEVTSDEEVRLTAFEDRNGDDKLNELDLDFVENADGDFEGEFTLWQQDFFWDRDEEREKGCTPGLDCTGFSVWAFADQPDSVSGRFTACEDGSNEGFEVEEYNHDFFGGRSVPDVLNRPTQYITEGDIVANEYLDGGDWVEGAYLWKDVYDRPTIRLGHEVSP
ncbi:MAG: hypothetical protein GWP91_06900 [Rhodobacterales bacterium]|nr:hypothetical protein [Rhodobacterales bacterium]